jgi:hypothetical protein
MDGRDGIDQSFRGRCCEDACWSEELRCALWAAAELSLAAAESRRLACVRP